MASQVIAALCIFSALSAVWGGEVTVGHSSTSVRFGPAGTMRATELDDVLAAALGYTPSQSTPWPGLTITSPFTVPVAAVVVGLRGGGATLRQEGITYGLKEDTGLNQVFQRLQVVYGSQAQRSTLFKYYSIMDELAGRREPPTNLPPTKLLNTSRQPDAKFLQEVAQLLTTFQHALQESVTAHKGQDIVFLQLSSLEQVVDTYGLNSPQVEEALGILRQALERVSLEARIKYDDLVLVVTVVQEERKPHVRKTRESPIIEDTSLTAVQVEDLNLNKEYYEDYPAIFNIILWLSIVLVLAIIATSVAMATMDPGRDSIIYRMTNPRMKKDN